MTGHFFSPRVSSLKKKDSPTYVQLYEACLLRGVTIFSLLLSARCLWRRRRKQRLLLLINDHRRWYKINKAHSMAAWQLPECSIKCNSSKSSSSYLVRDPQFPWLHLLQCHRHQPKLLVLVLILVPVQTSLNWAHHWQVLAFLALDLHCHYQATLERAFQLLPQLPLDLALQFRVEKHVNLTLLHQPLCQRWLHLFRVLNLIILLLWGLAKQMKVMLIIMTTTTMER